MSDIKYFVQTYYQLPNSKYLLDRLDALPIILQNMMDKKPINRVVTDFENSISIIKIDTEMVPNYKDIYKEMRFWHWDTVYIPKPRHKYMNEDGTPKTPEQIQHMVVEKREKLLKSMYPEGDT